MPLRMHFIALGFVLLSSSDFTAVEGATTIIRHSNTPEMILGIHRRGTMALLGPRGSTWPTPDRARRVRSEVFRTCLLQC
jgi:hypothetical protein